MTPNHFTLVFSLSLMLSLGGCIDNAEETVELNLGSVSFGDQLLDLKSAFEAGALSQAEYGEAKDNVLSILDTADALAGAVDNNANDDSDGSTENGTQKRVAIEFDTRDNEAEAKRHGDADDDDADDDGWIF